ncbi:MAG: leucine/isoleucine/valine transporter permease subunit [Armatimonadota bacterium]|nr:leucine/isoleucine/valine transporter permease subunit [Armatimonadota bacterium]
MLPSTAIHERSWRRTASTGLIWGGVAAFVSVAGMVMTFAEREIVAGIVSMGHALLFLTSLAAGYQAARRSAGGALITLGHGALAGMASGAVLAALAVLAHLVNLRPVLINASPELFALLTFGRGAAGAGLLPAVGAALGAASAVAVLLPPAGRRPLFAGLAWILFLGMFQELLQLSLLTGSVGGAIGEWLYSASGLLPRGALTVFAVAAGANLVWARRGAAVRGRLQQWSPGRRRGLRLAAFALITAGLLLVPAAGGPFLSQVMVLVGLFAVLGLGLNIVVGFAGLLDLGYVAFFAIGAYTMGLLTSTGEHGLAQMSFWAAVPIAMVVSMIAGVLLGIPVLKIRGDYLAIATLGFGEIIRLLVLSDFLRPWLGGSQGVLAIPKPAIGGFEFAGPEQLFYLVLASAALVMLVATRLRDSRLGRAWMAVREDEDVAEATGINLVNVKLLAFGLGAFFGGLSGAVFAVMLGSVFPHSFQLLISINVLALIIVGGMGSLPGVVVGSLALVGLPELLREFAEFRFLVYGAALVVMMQWRPEGLWPEPVRKRELRWSTPEEEVEATAPAMEAGERPA